MLGSELLVHATSNAPAVRMADEGIEIGTGDSMVVASLDPRDSVRAGERLTLALDTNRLHAFDLENGDAIAHQ